MTRYRRKPIDVEAERVTMVDGFQVWLVTTPQGRIFVNLRDFERDYEPIPAAPQEEEKRCGVPGFDGDVYDCGRARAAGPCPVPGHSKGER